MNDNLCNSVGDPNPDISQINACPHLSMAATRKFYSVERNHLIRHCFVKFLSENNILRDLHANL